MRSPPAAPFLPGAETGPGRRPLLKAAQPVGYKPRPRTRFLGPFSYDRSLKQLPRLERGPGCGPATCAALRRQGEWDEGREDGTFRNCLRGAL